MPPMTIHDTHRPHQRDLHTANARRSERAEPAEAAADRTQKASGEEEGFSFWDLLDVVNPLQHIPGVNRVYRAVTGDQIRPEVQMAGSAVLFGPVGLALAGADVVLKEETGKDAGEHLYAMVFGGEEQKAPDQAPPQTPATMVADAAGKRPAPISQPGDLAGDPAEATVSPMPVLPGAGMAPGAVADPATLAALRQEQLRRMAEVPGGSAAAMAAAGIPGAGAATLPAPGQGGGAAVMAALSQSGPASAASAEQPGMGLAQYRAQALPGGATPPKALIPPRVNQIANAERVRATQEALLRAQEESRRTQAETAMHSAENRAVEPRSPDPRPTASTTPPAAAAAGPGEVQTTSWTTGGRPELPGNLVADLMAANMAKYEQLRRQQGQGR
jgi:hypothetical protein